MVNHSYECPKCGHQFDKIVEWDQRYVKCEQCPAQAERTWATSRARRFREPVVLHKYADGTYGVPGRSDAKTPKGAERIECWNIPDYERALHKMNAAERATAARRHEGGEAMREEQMRAVREEVKHRMRNASSEWEKEMLAITLERSDKTYNPLRFQEFYSEAIEGVR